MKSNIFKFFLVAIVIPILTVSSSAREKQVFPPEYYAKQKTYKLQLPTILTTHPDDIFWKDVSSLSGGLMNSPYQMKVCDGALYVMGQEAASGYAAIGRYTKKDGWSIVCDIDVGGYLSTFSVDGDNIYIGGYFETAGPKQIPARNVVRYNIKTKGWYPMGDGLWDPDHPNVVNMIDEITAYKGLVFINGRYSHSGDKELSSNFVIWDGNGYVNDDRFNYLSAIFHDGIIYSFSSSVDTSKKIVNLGVTKWDGDELERIFKQYKWEITNLGVRGGFSVGIDSKKNYYFIGSYSYFSPSDSTKHIYGTYYLGFVDGKWKLLGGDKWAFNKIYYEDLVQDVDAYGQVYIAGDFKYGIGDDLTSFKRHSIIMWSGTEWNTMGSGIRDVYNVSCITYYDGDVYIGGNFGIAGDKETEGFAKWNNRPTTDTIVQPKLPEIDISEVHIYPNPASDYIVVEFNKDTTDCKVDIYNLYGSSVGSYNIVGRSFTINTEHLAIGVYMLKVYYGDRVASKTITILR
ncbi:MAG: T9SS type A sorting domain-containing protein [Ignavibacteria bacterium]|nr:T9SS type A sorting domain-containing protein [Ignavibacteria bacterium]